MRNHGFTLLEVVIALGILAVSLMILIETQAGAVWMVQDASKIVTATMLAEEKMVEAQLTLEREGWTDQDIEDEGNFESFGSEDFRGDGLNADYESELLDDFVWAYTVRKIDLTIPTNLGNVTEDLAGNGYWGDLGSDALEGNETSFDLSDIGISPEMITDHLASYIREVRVIVWWGENEEGLDQVELLTHVINPSGVVTETDDQEE